MKRIILCFDGTWNTSVRNRPSHEPTIDTNVWRFFRSIDPTGPDGVVQDAWYNEGVGTSRLNKLTGAAFGAGLDKHILDGYKRLVKVYEPGDQIYIIGFSRGAYTARSLVGMIRNCGIVRNGLTANLQIGVAYGIYRTRDDGPSSSAAVNFRKLFAHEAKIHFLGVWDTVGALGIPLSAAQRFNAAFYEFHDTELSAIVERAYHAIAVDEHRAEYDVTLWKPQQKPTQILEQRWFPGAHADVGGGYADRQLSDLTLRWMQDRAIDASLGLKPVALGPQNYLGPLTDSYASFLGGVHALAHPRFYRAINQSAFGNELIDDSTQLRRTAASLSYRPPNAGLPLL